MQLRRLACLAALALASPVVLANDWAADVTAHFVEPHTREHIGERAKATGKPVMVIAMTTWCGACAALRTGVNDGKEVKPLLEKFVVAYAMEEGPANVWTEPGQNYVPQVYFFNSDMKQLHVYASSEKYKYYFAGEDSLGPAMKKALDMQAQGTVGEPLAGATAPPAGPTSPAPTPDPNVAIFDPAHALDAKLAGHFLDNLKPEDLRKKAIEQNRPFMVWLTTSWCHACKDLIASINSGSHTADLLHAFVNNHAYGDDGLAAWQPEGEDYVPQVLFFDVDGTLLDVKGKNDKYKHFFSSDEDVGEGMAKALDASKAVGEL